MKVFTITRSSLIIAMFLVHALVAAASDETSKLEGSLHNEPGPKRKLQKTLKQKQMMMQQKQRQKQKMNHRMNPDYWAMDKWNANDDWNDHDDDGTNMDDWKMGDWNLKGDWNPKNDWKGSYKHKHEKKRLVFALDGCMFNYTSSDDAPDPIATNGGRTSDGVFTPGSYVFGSCNLFFRMDSNIYYAPVQAGTTSWSCLVTSITSLNADNDANFLCTVIDEISLMRKHQAHKASLISQGMMTGWFQDFKSATTGGTGGGVAASGQLNTFFTPQLLHVYYITAPYIEKSIPW
mmetsp:Transcript_16515/g.24294  ORF Transcript_16515/g.24294 Transcript_16515/m.24294 type:complete len:291 (+) Transcript_16515:115-987(+)